jgi:hypothetical protein
MATAYAQVSLDFSSFLGGSGSDSAQAVAVAPDGFIWVCGYTASANFPLVNPIDSTLGGSQDAFVSKLSPDGQTILFSTYLGGSSDDLAMGIAVDDHGDVYICGRTDSSDFPTLNAFQPTRGGFWTDMFICKLNSSGAMIYSSYLGGSMFDYGYDVAVDTSGCAYVAGKSYSTDFPTTVNAFQTTNMLESGYNFTLTKVASNGASLVYSTYLGGSGAGHDYPCVDVTPEGIAYFGGATTSTNYPVVNAYQATHAGPSPFSWDAVVSIFSADGSSLTYSTYLGGSEDLDQLVDLAIGADGSFTVVGITQSDNFPLVNPIQPAISGQPDLFVTRFAPDGQSLEFSTYLGGWDWDYGQGVAAGKDGSVVAVGTSVANNYPVFKAFQTTNAGGYECVVSRLSPDGTEFEYSTYLGGSGDEFIYRVAFDADGHAVVVGRTASDNFPTANPFQAARGGGEDGFVTRLKLMEYCESYSANHLWEFINRVQFNTIDNSSGGSFYSDFTTMTTEVERGNAYLITVNNDEPWNGDRCHVWVDWNRNFDFSDPGEEIELLTQNWAVFTNLITVPPGAASGPTRMRVALRDSGAGDPCGIISLGEVEDYTVSVSGQANQTISDFLPTDRSAFMISDTVGLSATASSGQPVVFTIRDGPALITDGTNLSFTSHGTVSVAASVPGYEHWEPATTSQHYFVRADVEEPELGEWAQINVDGFGNANNFSVFSMAIYSNELYAGTWNNPDGCEIWRWDGPGPSDWQVITNGGFGAAVNRGVHSMETFNGHLYVGTANDSDGFEVWSYNGTEWTQVASNGLGDSDNAWAASMAVHDGKLYVGSAWQGAVFTYDGVTWTQVNENGFGNVNNQAIRSLAAHDGKIYAGVYNTTDDAGLYRFDGPGPEDWTAVISGGFGGLFTDFRSLADYNDLLFIGGAGWSVSCQVWDYIDGSFARNDPGADMQYDGARCMENFKDRLFVGTGNDSGSPSGGQVWMYNGVSGVWTQLNENGFGDFDNSAVHCLQGHGNRIFAGVANSAGAGGRIYMLQWASSTIDLVTPSSGSWTGGYEVVINGAHLSDGGDITSVTLCGVSVDEIISQSATQVVVTAGAAALPGLGDVRVFSASCGETVNGNAFEYLREQQAPLVFEPASPQSYLSTNGLSTSGGSGTGAVSYTVLSGPGSIVNGSNLTVTADSGTIEIRATKAQDDLYFAASVTASVEATSAVVQDELRINCGGSDVGEWVKDYGFSGKTKTYGVSRKIKNTGIVPQNVMRRVRGVFAPNVLEYRFAQVPPGEYVVYLYFADIYAPGQGQARFDVQIQGVRVLAGFDVNGAASGFDRAIVKGFRVTVGGDGLQLKFKPRKGGAYINAIEVLPIRVEDAEIRSQSGISEKRTAFDGAFGKASVVPLDVWTSGNRDESCGGENAVDGNLSTAWIGDAEAETWWITLGYRLLTPVSGVNVLLGENSITNLSFIGSQDGVDWFDLEEALMNGPAELEYLWIQFLPGDGEANLVPNVLEIEVEKPDGD